MSPANAGRTPMLLRHLLAGLEAGITGALVMLIFSMLGSVIHHRSVWLLANLFSTTLYGETAYRGGFIRYTWGGLALFLVIYAVLGMFWGVFASRQHGIRVLLFGLLYAMVCFYALFHYVWPNWNPLIPLYFAESNLRVGHLLWGLCLARAPVYSQRILEVNREANRGAETDASPSGEGEIKTGELIR